MSDVLERLQRLRQANPTAGWHVGPVAQQVLLETAQRLEYLETLVDPRGVLNGGGFRVVTIEHPRDGSIQVTTDPRVAVMLTAIIANLEAEARMYRESFEGVVKGGDIGETVRGLVEDRKAAVEALADLAGMPCDVRFEVGGTCPVCCAGEYLVQISGREAAVREQP